MEKDLGRLLATIHELEARNAALQTQLKSRDETSELQNKEKSNRLFLNYFFSSYN